MDPQTYEALEEHLYQCEQEKKTFREVFLQDRVVSRARQLCRRNRRRNIVKFARALNISLEDSRKDAHACDEEEHITGVDLETETNMVCPMGQFLVFYARCTSTESAHNGLILNRALQLGPVVLSGPTTSTSSKSFFRGGTWSNSLYNAFPADMGPPQVPTKVLETHRDVFCWEGDQESLPPMLSQHYRTRDFKWQENETRLGYKNDQWAEPIELQPLLVKCSNT